MSDFCSVTLREDGTNSTHGTSILCDLFTVFWWSGFIAAGF